MRNLPLVSHVRDEEEVRTWNAEVWSRQIKLYKQLTDAIPELRDRVVIENSLTGETYPTKETCHE